jgi:hypothetical protein
VYVVAYHHLACRPDLRAKNGQGFDDVGYEQFISYLLARFCVYSSWHGGKRMYAARLLHPKVLSHQPLPFD